MSELSLSALLLAEGLLSQSQLDALKAELPQSASLEDVVLERGLVSADDLQRLVSLASTPAPIERPPLSESSGEDSSKTVWEYVPPELDDLDETGISPDAPTGRFPPRAGDTARWDEPIKEAAPKSGKTTRWEIPVPLPSDDPTGQWNLGPDLSSDPKKTAHFDGDFLSEEDFPSSQDLSETMVDLGDEDEGTSDQSSSAQDADPA